MQVSIAQARKLLKVTSSATKAEIEGAFRSFAMKWHPDRNGGSEEASRMFTMGSYAKQALLDALTKPETEPKTQTKSKPNPSTQRPQDNAVYGTVEVSVPDALKGGYATLRHGYKQYRVYIPAGVRHGQIVRDQIRDMAVQVRVVDYVYAVVGDDIIRGDSLPWWKLRKGAQIPVPNPYGTPLWATVDKRVGRDGVLTFTFRNLGMGATGHYIYAVRKNHDGVIGLPLAVLTLTKPALAIATLGTFFNDWNSGIEWAVRIAFLIAIFWPRDD